MVIVKAIMDAAPIFPMPDQAGSPQQFQLLADCGLLHSQRFSNGVDRQFSLFKEKQYFQTGGIPKHLEEVGDIGDFLIQGDGRFHIDTINDIHIANVPQQKVDGNDVPTVFNWNILIYHAKTTRYGSGGTNGN
jgi:hypothetical protein